MKKYPFFRMRDIAVYAALALITVILAIVPFSGGGEAEIYEVSLWGEVVYSYDCRTGKGTAYSSVCSEKVCGNEVFLTVRSGENLNEIRFCDGKAEMVGSNCPHGECVNNFAPLTGNGVIICLPHGLKITGKSGGGIVVPSGKTNNYRF